MNSMNPLKYIGIYCGAFFAVGWVCGYNPIAIYMLFPIAIYDPGLNGFELHRLPLQFELSPVLFLAGVYGIGLLVTYGLSAKKANFDFVVLRKNIFIGLICVGSIFMLFQLRGQRHFLKKNVEFDFQKFTIREKLPQMLHFAVRQANSVHEKYPGQALSLQLDMGEDCSQDPCFYVKRALEYYLYPIDVADIRGQNIEGDLTFEEDVLTAKKH